MWTKPNEGIAPSVYAGEWADDSSNGLGVYTWSNGAVTLNLPPEDRKLTGHFRVLDCRQPLRRRLGWWRNVWVRCLHRRFGKCVQVRMRALVPPLALAVVAGHVALAYVRLLSAIRVRPHVMCQGDPHV